VLTAIRDDGQLVGFAKITRDLTERKQMEVLAAKTAQLQASNRLKSEFMATMSHELRTPLNAIIGFTELVFMTNGGALDEMSVSNLNTVLRNARHLLTLINEILDLAKIEAGQSTVHPVPFDANQLVATVVGSTRALAEQKGLAIAVEAAPDLGLVVSDETKVRQILINLLSNAVKFTDAGGITVRVAGKGPDAWTFEVADTGVGIAPEHHDLVFQEFRQVDASTTRATGGTGLGLAISRKLVGLLGGRLTLASTPGAGSTFTVELPRHFAARPAATPDAPPAADAGAPDGEGPLVLAIDDDPDALRLIAENLRDSRYRVVTATDPESGLALARELAPAAITLDVLMPKVDGWMVLRRLKADPATRAIPVILASFLENRGLAAKLGAEAYLSKPFDRQELLSALDHAMRATAGREAR
jgi:CheY-like chemotaxis protein/nitrogen-specific signal transduction histidine kinase